MKVIPEMHTKFDISIFIDGTVKLWIYCSVQTFIRYARMIGKPNEAIKPKDLNRIAKINYGHLFKNAIFG
jgi:hypothetical protein